MGVNAYFGTRRRNRPHATPNYGPGKSKFKTDYYRQTYFPHFKNNLQGKLEKSGK